MTINHKLSIDLARREPVARIDTVQDDRGRKLALALYANGVPWSVPGTVRAVVRYCKSDGTGGEYDTLPDGTCAWSAAENILTIALAPQVLCTPGSVALSVLLTDDSKAVSTFEIPMYVHPGIPGRITKPEGYAHAAPAPAVTDALSSIGAGIMSGRITSIVLLGDSITDGAGGTGYNGSYSGEFSTNTEGYCWANAFKKFALERYGIQVKNNGMFGTTLRTQQEKALAQITDRDFVIWLTGTNDRWDPNSYRNDLRHCLGKIRDRAAGMLVISGIPATQADEQEKPVSMQKMDEIIMSELAGFVPHFSMYQAMTRYCGQRGIPLADCFADHCHPNDLGYFIMFRLLCEKLGLPLDPYTDYEAFGRWWNPPQETECALATSTASITDSQCSPVALDAGVVPMALMHGYNSSARTSIFSGKHITAIELYVMTAGIITIGTADLNTCGQGKPAYVRSQKVEVTQTGLVRVPLDWDIGIHETLCLQSTTDTGALGFVVTGTPMRIWQASEFEAGANGTDITVHGTVFCTVLETGSNTGKLGSVLLDGTDDYEGAGSAIFLLSDIVPTVLMTGYDSAARTTAVSGKRITGAVMQVNIPGLITIGKVDLTAMGQMPVFTESRTFLAEQTGDEVIFPLYMELGPHETLAFQCTSDTGALSFVTVSGDLFIWKSSAFAAGNKDAELTLVGKIYGN